MVVKEGGEDVGEDGGVEDGCDGEGGRVVRMVVSLKVEWLILGFRFLGKGSFTYYVIHLRQFLDPNPSQLCSHHILPWGLDFDFRLDKKQRPADRLKHKQDEYQRGSLLHTITKRR